MSGSGELFERIDWEGKPLAYVVRATARPRETTFVTPEEANLQLGFVVYPGGGRVVPHAHLETHRTVVGTPELLLVKEGRCIVDLFNAERILIQSIPLEEGDAVLLLGGAHGIRMLEDTILLEAKQGPYLAHDKERFDPGLGTGDSDDSG